MESITPFDEEKNKKLKKYENSDKAWSDIEDTLNNTDAEFSDWRDAIKCVRKRDI